MIISSIIYSKKLLDIHKRYSVDSPDRVRAEGIYSLESIRTVELYTRRKALKEYGRNRTIESLAYIVILGAALATL